MNVIEAVVADMCTGCGACVAVCPIKCVQLKLDKDGYYKRDIQKNSCLNCGKCINVCSALCKVQRLDCSKSFVVYAKNRQIAEMSASGGVAYLLSKRAIEKEYYVIGAVWDIERYGVKHTAVNRVEQLNALRKSKYVQSYTAEIMEHLDSIPQFIMIGTPCQVAAARNIVGNREDVLLVDMDCMGPAGKNLLDKYIYFLRQKNSSGIESIQMRDKTKDWMTYGVKVNFLDGSTYYQDKYADPFCICFNFAHSIQDTCLKNCRYCDCSMADIRIGDAWDYFGKFSRKVVRGGMSLVSIQTEKGLRWIQEIEPDAEIVPVKRKLSKKIDISADKKIMEILRQPDKSIEDAVKIYKEKSMLVKSKRKIQEIISKNYYLYLLAKQVKEIIK